ncbi:MAG: DUF1206 domain-containing protein [Gemmatimonadota bacterium]
MQCTEGDATVHWSAVVMAHPAGRYAVASAGLFAAGYGFSQLVRTLRRKVDEHLRRLHMPSDTKRWVVLACKFGIGARGVVFGLVGWFLVQAARESDAQEAKDFGRSLNELRQQPMGRTLLLVVALGLLACRLVGGRGFTVHWLPKFLSQRRHRSQALATT